MHSTSCIVDSTYYIHGVILHHAYCTMPNSDVLFIVLKEGAAATVVPHRAAQPGAGGVLPLVRENIL